MGSIYLYLQGYHHTSKWIKGLTITFAVLGLSFAACKVIKELKVCRKVRYSWRCVAKSSPLFPRYAHSLTTLKCTNGKYPKVFVIGGDGIVSESLDVYVLDQALSTWSVVTASCKDVSTSEANFHRRWSHTSSGVGQSIFVFGGHLIGAPVSTSSLLIHAVQNEIRSYSTMPTRETAELLEFDSANFIWSVPSLHGRPPCARCSHTATVIGTRIFVFGGYGKGVPLNDVHILDTFLGAWIIPKVIGAPPSPRCSHSACVVDHGKRILIYGGYGSYHQQDIWFLEVNTPFVRTQEEICGGEVVAWTKGYIGEVPQPVILCGPSGVGKSTLIRKLIQDFPKTFGFSISHTTRSPREQEQHGVHYHFTTREVMELEIEEGKFLEFAEVHDNLYGTSISAIEAIANAHKRCVLDIDVQGARLVKHSSFRAIFIFVAPSSYEELEHRLRCRGTESDGEITRRLRNAKAELQEGQNLWLFDHVLINKDFETTYEQLKRLLDLDCSCLQVYPELKLSGNPLCSYCTSQTNMSLSYTEMEEPDARSCHTAVAIGNRVFIYGGTKVGGASNELLVLDLAQSVGGAPGSTRGLRWLASEPEFAMHNTKLWSPRQLSKRYNHQAVKLSSEEMLITGGFDGKNALHDSFIIKVKNDTQDKWTIMI